MMHSFHMGKPVFFGSLMAVASIIVAASVIYGISDVPPNVTRVSTAQFADQTFEESVEKAGLIVVGTVIDVGIKVFPEDVMDTDEDGNEYVFEHNEIPRAEITLQIQEVLKDDVGLTSDTVTFYDEVNGAIGQSNSQKAKFISQYAIDYQKGDKGFFLIDNDEGLAAMGYTSFYPILEGKETITTELDKLVGKDPLDLSDAKDIARSGGN